MERIFPHGEEEKSDSEKLSVLESSAEAFWLGFTGAIPLTHMESPSLIPSERIEQSILVVRDQKVMLDRDLARLYGVSTKNLNKAVSRNRDRFPDDFMFQLSEAEFSSLRFQTGTSTSRGGRRYRPYVFNEQGVAMLSGTLQSKRAVAVNIAIMRAFVRLRRTLASHKELAVKLEKLEAQFVGHDQKIAEIFNAIRTLMHPPVPRNRRRIGFNLDP